MDEINLFKVQTAVKQYLNKNIKGGKFVNKYILQKFLIWKSAYYKIKKNELSVIDNIKSQNLKVINIQKIN